MVYFKMGDGPEPDSLASDFHIVFPMGDVGQSLTSDSQGHQEGEMLGARQVARAPPRRAVVTAPTEEAMLPVIRAPNTSREHLSKRN